MKISKYFMVAAASIMMFGCAKNDENNGPHFDGPIALSLDLVMPDELGSKAFTDKTSGNNNEQIPIEYSFIDVKLNAASGGSDDWETILADTISDHIWYDVIDPVSVEVRIHDGAESYTAITDLKEVEPKDMKVYGKAEAVDFDMTRTTTHNGTTYDVYTATVNVYIPVARIEVSGVKHMTHGEGNCEYSELTLDGVYLDNVAATGVNFTYPYTSPVAGTEWTWETAQSGGWYYAINGENFNTSSTVYPTDESVYAFNIFPTQMPLLKFKFTGKIDDVMEVAEDRYAVVTSYNGQDNFTFEAGNIYRIIGVEITDDAISGNDDGKVVAVDVKVEVKKWTIVDTTVEF